MASGKKHAAAAGALVVNRKAAHDYTILERFEAGIELVGTEVKVLRNGEGGLLGAWCKIDDANQLWLMQVRIPPYAFGNRFNHEALRTRRLLMHKAEILRLRAKVEQKGLSPGDGETPRGRSGGGTSRSRLSIAGTCVKDVKEAEMRPGLWQILIVVLIIALVFGAKKIPEIARALGRSSGEFKKGLKEGNEAAAGKADEIKRELFDSPAEGEQTPKA